MSQLPGLVQLPKFLTQMLRRAEGLLHTDAFVRASSKFDRRTRIRSRSRVDILLDFPWIVHTLAQ
jgi:hypothetical protein